MSLAEEAGTNVLCRWISNHELGASFENLFQPIDNLKVTGEATFHPRSANSCKGFKKFRNRMWNKLLGIDECFKESDIDKYFPERNSEYFKLFHDLIFGYLNGNKNVYVETCSLLFDKCKVDMFKPETCDFDFKSFLINTFFCISHKGDWFIQGYVVLFLSAPLINKALEKIDGGGI